MKAAKKSIILIVLAYPFAYFLTIAFQLLSDYVRYLTICTFSENTAQLILQLLPSVGSTTSILSLVISINSFAILLWCQNAQSV